MSNIILKWTGNIATGEYPRMHEPKVSWFVEGMYLVEHEKSPRFQYIRIDTKKSEYL